MEQLDKRYIIVFAVLFLILLFLLFRGGQVEEVATTTSTSTSSTSSTTTTSTTSSTTTTTTTLSIESVIQHEGYSTQAEQIQEKVFEFKKLMHRQLITVSYNSQTEIIEDLTFTFVCENQENQTYISRPQPRNGKKVAGDDIKGIRAYFTKYGNEDQVQLKYDGVWGDTAERMDYYTAIQYNMEFIGFFEPASLTCTTTFTSREPPKKFEATYSVLFMETLE